MTGSPDTDPPIDRYAVLGHPVTHSRSPFIHAAFAQATGQRLTYGRIDCPPGALPATLAAFVADGGRGCNITVPLKFEAAALCARLTPRARLAGATNTLQWQDDGWLGDNTDGIGLVRDIVQNADRPLAGARVLLVGAGGAAAGVLGPMLSAGAAEVQVVNRGAARAAELCAAHAALAATHGARLHVGGLGDAGTAFDVVVNATSSSLAGGDVPAAPAVLRPGSLAVDLMYGPAAQPFLAWARAHGATGRDGLGMLVEQAAEAFALWRGVRPLTTPVLADLRDQIDAEAAGGHR